MAAATGATGRAREAAGGPAEAGPGAAAAHAAERVRPALGLLELSSVALGLAAGDAMVKRSPVAVVWSGSVHPGRYLVLVGGEVADVHEAMEAGRLRGEAARLDEVLLPDVHPQVVAAVAGARREGGGDTLGVVETRTVSCLLAAADRGVKGAHVELAALAVADGLGGKAYCVFLGEQADVEAAVELAAGGLEPEALVARVVVPRFHDEMLENLLADLEFARRVGARRAGAAASGRG